MDSIIIRYGQDLTLPIDAGDETATSASIFIGEPGKIFTLTKTVPLSLGKGVFNLSGADTSIPLGTYFYQINVTDANGYVSKYPSADDCSDCTEQFPKFVVCEALDVVEVS